jgi:hypothetical protein
MVTVLVGDSGDEQSLPESVARSIRVRSATGPSDAANTEAGQP